MLLLVDYSSLLYRAFFAVPESVPTNAVYGLLGMLTRLVADRRPTRIAIAVDDDWRPAFRVEALPSYKAHRVSDEPDPVTPQEAVGREVLDAFGFAVVGAAGFEADDVIGTLAAHARGRVEIVSGDRDLFALVRDPHVRVLYPVKGVSTLAEVDEAEVTRRFGIPGRAYGDYAILRGDPSDGLPGVPGIGGKTAARLLQEHGSLRGILAAKDLPPAVARRLHDARDYLVAAQRVVLPVTTVPLPDVVFDVPPTPARPRVLQRLATEYRLAGAVERLQRAIAAPTGPDADVTPSRSRS